MPLLLLLAVVANGMLVLSAGAQVTVTDDLRRAVTLPRTPERIVSLAPSITETLFAIGAGNQVAGVTDYCNYPEEARKKPRVGGMINPSIETIVSLRPDLIILSVEGNLRDDFQTLTRLGTAVFVTNPRTLEGIHKSIADLGMLTGRTEESARVLWSMQSLERAVLAPMKMRIERSALLIVSLHPLIVAGSGTFLAEILALAGGRNLAASSPSAYPQFSREAVVDGDPEVLFVLSDAGGGSQSLTDLYPEWRRVRAVRNGRVYYVDADILSRPGPRAASGLELVARLLNAKP